ncbi:MAG: hypothetical protein ACRDZZ_00360 [Ilumatobacteraceae bacterium]
MMPPLFTLADLYAQGSLQRVAYSALPDAPVQPTPERARRTHHLLAALRRPRRRQHLRLAAVGSTPASSPSP